MKFKVLKETDNYSLISVPGGNEGRGDLVEAMGYMMSTCEDLRSQGYRPLHYVPKLNAWFCERFRGMLKNVA